MEIFFVSLLSQSCTHLKTSVEFLNPKYTCFYRVSHASIDHAPDQHCIGHTHVQSYSYLIVIHYPKV